MNFSTNPYQFKFMPNSSAISIPDKATLAFKKNRITLSKTN